MSARTVSPDLLKGDLNSPELQKRALYAAFESGDTRFDGQVFVGVSSTGIYCRTVCTARMPKYENCTFFRTAAEAEAAGFRPCMTCRPEAAPGNAEVDAKSSLARRASALLHDECASGMDVEALSAKLGYTARHLRRVFEDELGVTPSQYLQTCRLLLAKSLLTDSALPVSQVALASGFGSVRRFNQVFKDRYRMTPTELRKRRRAGAVRQDGATVRLGYRPPYRFEELLAFFRVRALEGVEAVGEHAYARTVVLRDAGGREHAGWVRVEDDAGRNQLVVTVAPGLLPCLSQVVARIRRQFDVDCDPQAVFEGLAPMSGVLSREPRKGVRLPGCFEPFETACRAVLGQQVSVKAANRLAARIVEAYGPRVDTGVDGLCHAFPAPEDVCALASVEDAFGELGVIKTRSRVIVELARLVTAGDLDFGAGAIAAEQMARLLSVKGIGPWTANYIAMRALAYPDAFLESDAGVAHALPDYTPKQRLELAEAWRPWRSYAVMALWGSLG